MVKGKRRNHGIILTLMQVTSSSMFVDATPQEMLFQDQLVTFKQF